MPEIKTDTITLRIEPGVKAGLKPIAAQERRSLANMIEVMIRDYCGRSGVSIPERAYSAEICHRFRSESGHSIHAKPAIHSGGKRPRVGAKRRGVGDCYAAEAVVVNFANRFRMDSPFKWIR